MRARRRRRAFTLLNLLVSVAVLGVLSGLAVVSLAPDDGARVIGAAQMLASDLEYAQALSLADPDRPAVLRLDTGAEGYWIARVEEPDTPVLDPAGNPVVRLFGLEDAAHLVDVDLEIISGATDGWVEFDGFGRLTELAAAVLEVRLGDEARRVRVSSATGFASIEIP